MKLFKTLTISLAATLCAATMGVGAAFATDVQDETVYPDGFECSLTFESGLTDYAVYGESYAFAYSGQLAVLTQSGNNERLPDIKPVSSITGLEYSQQGELYVCFADGYCAYPDLTTKHPLSEITVQGNEQYLVSIGSVSYALDKNDGSMLYIDGSFTPVTLQEAHEGEVKFSRLKVYNDTAYAVMNNCLYQMDGSVAVKINPTYNDLTITQKISTGTAAEALKSDSPIRYGWIEKDKYYTEINLENELGSTFDIPNPETATTLSSDRLYCTVLAESGNAYIVIMNGKSYLVAKTSVTLVAETPSLNPADTDVAYAIENIGVYAKPYVSPTTKLGELKSGSANAVTVLGQYTDFSGIEYYKITYSDGEGRTVTGYVAKRLMTSYAFPAEDENVNKNGGDSEFKYDSNMVTVALAVAIVALVLIAVLYIGIASSRSGKKKKKKAKQQAANKKKSAKEKRRSEEDDDFDDYDDEEEE